MRQWKSRQQHLDGFESGGADLTVPPPAVSIPSPRKKAFLPEARTREKEFPGDISTILLGNDGPCERTLVLMEVNQGACLLSFFSSMCSLCELEACVQFEYCANSDWAKSVFSIPEASPTPMHRPAVADGRRRFRSVAAAARNYPQGMRVTEE